MNRLLKALVPRYTSEFHRKRRDMTYLCRWKAVEFRSFLLYIRPVVLKEVLEKEKYEHFLHLHVAIRILTSGALTQEAIHSADSLLKYFVDQFGRLYGKHHLVYNVHALTHLANDCSVHGCLDSFSAYPFESFLGSIKRLIRTGHQPLPQLARRLSEYAALEVEPIINRKTNKKFSLKSIKPKSKADSYCRLEENGIFVHVTLITDSLVYGKQFLDISNYYTEPIESSYVGVYKAKKLGNVILSWDKSKFENNVQKCMVLNHKSEYVIMPLIHQMW